MDRNTLNEHLNDLASRGEYRQAALLLEQLLEQEPGDWTAGYRLAWLQDSLGRPHRALETIRRWIHLDEVDDWYWHLYGMIAEKSGELDEAERAYEKASRLFPDNIYILGSLAELRLGRCRLEAAASTIDSMIASAPDSPETIRLRLALHCRRGEDVAVRDLAKRLKELPLGNEYEVTAQAFTLCSCGKHREAHDILVSAPFPLPIEARVHLLVAMTALGKRDAALEYGAALVRELPDYPDARAGYGKTLYKFKRYDKARKVFERLVEECPDIEYREWLARSELRSGKLKSAFERAEQILLEDPDSSAARWVLKLRRRLYHPLIRWMLGREDE
jgi:tetratricopeptide (TPR) repeat protein